MRVRPRRLRRTAVLRDLAAEVRLSAAELIQPHFVLPGEGARQSIDAMPGIERQSVDLLVEQVKADLDLGIRAVLLFGVPSGEKHPDGRGAFEGTPLVARAVSALREAFDDRVCVVTDVCLCAYTQSGHCGVVDARGEVVNDATLPLLARMALAHARAGAHVVAPSDMMDGRVGAIRDLLDAEGYSETAILSYAAKFASAYYGPFREAAGSAPGKGDRKGYQADPRDGRGAVRDALLDEEEGADMLMVKPALAYLDVIAHLRAQTDLPLACYNVSGEYSMVKAAARDGLVDEASLVVENLVAMRRAGADLLITYHAREALRAGWIS
ncbi:MAG: porphobilinogen synthase [Planctomycetota bacterium]|nr:MAG: porphobilinogen synthase [Planctomycetota bacterium]